ncbi:MAG: sugar phosphate isomerase/epimerase [Planctomycetota bacterium]|nr:MAG: sugar phosphate isomerase/epimerase [Planctomycetota bacterium]
MINRRQFLGTAAFASGMLASGVNSSSAAEKKSKFEISLAAWSLHRIFFDKKIDQLGMVKMCRKNFDIGGFEMVNTMFPSPTYHYCQQLKKIAKNNGVKLLLIMCDREGDMSHPDKKQRLQAAKNHHKWVDIAAVLGCHSIRCNMGHVKKGDMEMVKRAAESFSTLTAYGKSNGIKIIIENHGHGSSDPATMVALMKQVNDPKWFGTLPDFGNFPEDVDKYDAVKQMMPYAHAVSAKCYDFEDDTGLETKIDFARMIKIVTDAGYTGHIGIEYEGKRLDEATGIKRAKALLEKLRF